MRLDVDIKTIMTKTPSNPGEEYGTAALVVFAVVLPSKRLKYRLQRDGLPP